MHFLTNNASKQAIIQNLQLAFERDEIRILNAPILKNELLNFEEKRTASGLFSYNVFDGQHTLSYAKRVPAASILHLK